MLTKRIIAALDIRGGRTVKGIQFESIRDAGDPVELAIQYSSEGIDELVFLDIDATHEGRRTFLSLVRDVAKVISIPFTVGGGVRSKDDVRALLSAGADKVFINSAAVADPDLISTLSKEFGSQCVVVAIDTRRDDVEGDWKVYVRGGRTRTELGALAWATEACERGAGEILLTSMNHDGEKKGFALDITMAISKSLPIPVIASGGAGELSHFKDVFHEGSADAALAASVFHFGEISVRDLKEYLYDNKISVRR